MTSPEYFGTEFAADRALCMKVVFRVTVLRVNQIATFTFFGEGWSTCRLPTAVRLPQKASPLIVLVTGCETQQPPAFPTTIDDVLSASGQGALNQIKFSKYHNAPASASTVLDLVNVALRTLSTSTKLQYYLGNTQPIRPRRGIASASTTTKILTWLLLLLRMYVL